MASKELSNDQQNFVRLGIASVDEIALVLKNILGSQVKPEDLYGGINSCPELITGKRKLRPHQLRICSIPPPLVPDYNQFDVTLLYTLIRNLCQHLEPTQGWGKKPGQNDVEIGDDIERLRFLRNEMFAHLESSKVSDGTFMSKWTELETVMKRCQQFMLTKGYNVKYEEDLRDIRKSNFGFEDRDKYKLLLEGTMHLNLKEDSPRISIHGIDKVRYGGKACFNVDVEPKSNTWDIVWQRVRGNTTKQIDIKEEKYRDSTERQLVIERVSEVDEDEYQAMAIISRELNGQSTKITSNSIFLTVGDLPEIHIEGPVETTNDTYVFIAIVKSKPGPLRVTWKVKTDNGEYIPIDINDEEYQGTSDSLCQPVLVVKRNLKRKSFLIEVENSLGFSRKYLQGISSVRSENDIESNDVPLVTETKRLSSCKCQPIRIIQFTLEGRQNEHYVSETCLNSKALAHILTHEKCRLEMNTSLENMFKVKIAKAPDDSSKMTVSVENKVTFDEKKRKEIYEYIDRISKKHIKIVEIKMEVKLFSCADFKFGRFLQGMEDPGSVSLFFDESLYIVGHDDGIGVFEKGILSTVLSDEVVRDTMNIEEDHLDFLKVIRFTKENDFSVQVTMEKENGIGKVTLTGLREDVVNVKRSIKKYLPYYRNHFWCRRLEKDELSLLEGERALSHLREKILENKCKYLIEKDNLYVASKVCTTQDIEKGIGDIFFKFDFSLNKEQERLFMSNKWLKFKKLLLNDTARQVIVTVTEAHVFFTCICAVKQVVKSRLETFLKENEIYFQKLKWNCAEETKEMCKTVKFNEIKEMKKKSEDEFLEISIKEDGFEIKGTKAGIKHCKDFLAKLTDDNMYCIREFAVSSDEILSHFSTHGGQQCLQEIERRYFCRVQMKTFCKIYLKHGNIVDEEVDVIVSSVHTDLTLDVAQSTVAKAIYERGGNDYQNKLAEKTNGRMQCGEVVGTEASGSLRCKAVYHACLSDDAKQTKEIVFDMVLKCLRKADREKFKSISFPALGTGIYNFPTNLVAEGMLEAILKFSNDCQTSTLRDVAIVLFTGKNITVREDFNKEYNRRLCVRHTTPLMELENDCITHGKFIIIAESEHAISKAKKNIEDQIETILKDPQK